MTPDDEHRIACAVCGRILDKHETWENKNPAKVVAIWYDHTTQDLKRGVDHLPVPTPVSEIPEQLQARCDFCNITMVKSDESWVLPVQDFVVAGPHINSGDFQACKTCAECLKDPQWAGLIDRVRSVYQDFSGEPPPDAEVLQFMYGMVRANVTGPIYQEA